MSLDSELLSIAEFTGKYAATLQAVSTILRDKPVQGGCILISVDQRNKLCGLLDDTAQMLDELSIASEQDNEELDPDGDEETRL